MEDYRYNWLLGGVRDMSSQTALLFASDTAEEEYVYTTMPQDSLPTKILKSVFGYDSFRPMQESVIKNVLDGRDTLAIMPTGGGKSLCYEIPSLIFAGLTVVVSPLIALMQDQVEQLEALGVPAAFLNSTLDRDSYNRIAQGVRSRKIKLLYVSPEGLGTERMQDLLHSENVDVDCITIDEAHCVSEWGHDFRPDYMEIGNIRSRFPKAVCLALTATATARVRTDIVAHLKLEEPAILVASFNRPNLFLEVWRKTEPFSQVIYFLREHKDESGIIYCFSRKQVDALTDFLQEKGIRALNYHAGLADDTRATHQRDFIQDKVQVMVATLAFGMGINKPDVRFVIHFDMPKSLEQYYQEIGRAGRDGLPSSALLLYSPSDIQKIRYILEKSEDRGVQEKLLTGMISYIQSNTCRRHFLLAYFGETYNPLTKDSVPHDECCDICASDGNHSLFSEAKDVTIPAQKYMSCVLRTHERYGSAYVIDVLMGAQNTRIMQNGDDSLSTYGIGRDLSKKDWQNLSRSLMEAGYIKRSEEHKTISVTTYGREMLRTRQSVMLPVQFHSDSERKATRQKVLRKPLENDSEATRIIEELRTWRKRKAEDLNIPPYCIFGDKTLYSIAATKPTTKGELTKCYGMGNAKVSNFGTAILNIVSGE